MKRLFLVTVLLLASLSGTAQQPAPKQIRFADQIEAYLKADQVKPPPKNAILFVGSSIFRLWKNLPEQMAPLPVFNRAFGGSRTEEVLYYMDIAVFRWVRLRPRRQPLGRAPFPGNERHPLRLACEGAGAPYRSHALENRYKIVLPYQPKIIVYYCGSNDINANITPQSIAGNFKQFVARVHQQLPQTQIFFVSINRAPQKKDKWPQVDEANKLVKDFCTTNKKLGFIDVNSALFDQAGQPRMELYLPDQLHFQEPAYIEFTAIIKPVITKAWQQK